MRTRQNIHRRGDLWIVSWRHNGKQEWRSFPSEEQAELFAAKHVWPRRAREQYEPPAKVTFGQAAAEWLRWGKNEGGPRGPWKASTRRSNRSALKVHFTGSEAEPGWLRDVELGRITAGTLERWRRQALADGMSRRNAEKLTGHVHAVFERARRAFRHPTNPVDELAPLHVEYDGRVRDFYGPEEIHALVRAAASEQDAAIFLTAAFTGLRRGELVALRWRDVDFARQVLRVEHSYDYEAGLVPTKGHKVRSVPMAAEVAQALARLEQRQLFTDPTSFVFVGEQGGPVDGSALRRRFDKAVKAAKVRRLTFHELRHTFGTVAGNAALSPGELQAWLGHADLKTTERYWHYRSRGDEAGRLDGAFAASGPQASEVPTAADGLRADAPGDGDSPAVVRVSAEPDGTGRSF